MKSSLWNAVATVAALVGTAAAVYPLITSDKQVAHIVHSYKPTMIRVVAFNEPLVLTGEWAMRRSSSWSWSKKFNDETFRTYPDKELKSRPLKGADLRPDFHPVMSRVLG